MKSIIVEGFDGCGKSTLARKLGEFYQIGVHSIGGPPISDESACHMSNSQLAIYRNATVVFDRITCLSRLCYEEDLSDDHVDLLLEDFKYIADGCTVIWADTINPMHAIKAHDTQRHLESITNRRFDIHRQYTDYMGWTNHILWDISKSNFGDLCNLIDLENAGVDMNTVIDTKDIL